MYLAIPCQPMEYAQKYLLKKGKADYVQLLNQQIRISVC